MATKREQAAEIYPDLVRRTGGGWLAASPKKAAFVIAVTADSEEEAKEKFRYVYGRWLEIAAVTENSSEILDIPKVG